MSKHKKQVVEVKQERQEIAGAVCAQMAVVRPAQDYKDAVEKAYAPVKDVVPEGERATFYVVGTFTPMINGKRVSVRGTKENSFKYSTDDKDVIAWLENRGFARKGA